MMAAPQSVPWYGAFADRKSWSMHRGGRSVSGFLGLKGRFCQPRPKAWDQDGIMVPALKGPFDVILHGEAGIGC